MDGGHTHHLGPNGSALAVFLVIVAALALATQVARAVAAILQALLIVLAVAVGLAIAGLIARVVIACRRYRPARLRPIRARSWPQLAVMPAADDRDLVSLRQAIAELEGQLYAARVAALAPRPAEAHQHLHVHGLAPEQIAALLAAARDRQEGEGR